MGAVTWTSHATREIAKDGMTQVDAVNVMRAGIVEPAELESGSWRYRVRTSRFYVVVAFRAELSMVVVTAWRIR
jgi:hypothetical protein